MSETKKPRKPSSPIGHIVFPKKGKIYPVIETLPDSADDLEQVIVNKFIGALKHFEQRELGNLQRGDIWPDFKCKERNQTVGIEIVEVVNQDHAGKRHIQDQYSMRVRELIDDIYPRLAGLKIQLLDGYQQPPYPSLTTQDGQQLAKSIADNLKAEVERFEHLPRQAVRRWQKGPALPETGAIITRVSLREEGSPAVLCFQGAFPEGLSKVENLLRNSIEGKVSKNYPRFTEGKLCLLAYEVFGMSVGPKPSKAAAIAHELLRSKKHPFDEVWYCFPYADKALGHIEKVWP